MLSLLSPDGEDPILFGLNRQVAKGLSVVQNTTNSNTVTTALPPYPCSVVNRFECPYDYKNENIDANSANTNFDVEDLFELSRMVHAVERVIRIAQRRKQTGYNNNNNSKVRILTDEIVYRAKQKLYHILTERAMLSQVLDEALEYVSSHDRKNDAYVKYEYNKKYGTAGLYQEFETKEELDAYQKELGAINEMYCSYYQGENKVRILDYLTKIKDDVKLEEFQACACCELID